MATVDRRGVSVNATDTAIAGSPNPGLAIKAPCRVATTGNITLSGLQTIDGVALAAGNRVLVWQQTDPTANGLYNASTGLWTRTVDAQSNDQFASGMLTEVSAGALYARGIFQLTSPDPIVLTSSSLVFALATVAAERLINTAAPLAGGGALGADLNLSLQINGSLQVTGGQLAVATLAGVASKWVSSFNAAGVPQLTQPSYADLSGPITGTGSAVFSASPALTGVPTAPTAAALTNSTQIATTAYADTADALALKKASNLADVASVPLARANLVAQAQGDYAGMSNGTLVASAAAGALTVAVKTFAGADPSAADPVYFYFRDNTLTAGDFTRIAVTAALSVVLGSTQTLGALNATGVRVWIGAFNNAGTVQLAAINCSDAAGVFCPQENVKYATTVPGSLSKAWCSTVAIGTTAPWRFIGFCEWNSLTTAGTWVAPDIVQLFGPGIKKPGDTVQKRYFTTTTNTTTTLAAPGAATSLTNTITPASAANLVEVLLSGSGANVSGFALGGQLGRNSNSNLFGGTLDLFAATTTISGTVGCSGLDKPNSTSSITYTLYIWASAAGNSVQWLPSGASQQGSLTLTEIMG